MTAGSNMSHALWGKYSDLAKIILGFFLTSIVGGLVMAQVEFGRGSSDENATR
jgi:hypothetical protein